MIASLDLLQAGATVAGIAGALLVTSTLATRRKTAFVAWVMANAAWVVVGLYTGNSYLALLFGVYLVTAIYGLKNNTEAYNNGTDATM